jgi:uroporphyrinogen decarboxylase
MTRRRIGAVAGFAVSIASAAVLADLALDWFTVDGGGGASTGGGYELSGTAGRPDAGAAGAMTGGGAGSSTLISPDIHREFCLPYDHKMHSALRDLGFKITYHTCGGTYGIEEFIIANGCDASETLAPPSVGGNQEPWEFKAKVGKRLALIGGVDQFNIATTGSRQQIRDKVHELFEKVGYDGGYICSMSDHFFETPPENLQAFADAARECVY